MAAPQKRSFLASLFSRDKDAEEADDNATARETAPPASRGVSAKSESSKPEANKPAAPGPRPNRLRRRARRECPAAGAAAAAAADLSSRRRGKPAGARPPAPRAAAPIQLASLSPNEIVNMRGLWDNTADAAAAKSAGRRNQRAERIERAPHPDRFAAAAT